jgi:hypothetical protein
VVEQETPSCSARRRTKGESSGCCCCCCSSARACHCGALETTELRHHHLIRQSRPIPSSISTSGIIHFHIWHHLLPYSTSSISIFGTIHFHIRNHPLPHLAATRPSSLFHHNFPSRRRPSYMDHAANALLSLPPSRNNCSNPTNLSVIFSPSSRNPVSLPCQSLSWSRGIRF